MVPSAADDERCSVAYILPMARTPAGTQPHPKGAERFHEERATFTVRGSPPDPDRVIAAPGGASRGQSASRGRAEDAVKGGEAIRYEVAVENPGDIAGTGDPAGEAGATCGAPPAAIAVGETAHVACTRTAAV